MFPERLRAIRRGRHITLDQLADALSQNLSPNEKPNTASQIGNWERGIRTPSYIEVRKLSEFFDVSLDYLTGKTELDEYDLGRLFLSGKRLTFNGETLSSQDRYEVYQLIEGYLHGRQTRRPDVPIDHQEELDLGYDDEKE
ncbi:MAG: helix-turn-helix domain-containing protein [Furfurilactobacillus sp.]|jgi:transcriptional regulator with XRE-family HTH domain|uniref:Transcription regulator n=3 Tax=Furfurilactobacillus TaxID=2767882 RepID=A0A0R1RHZ7_9LACO|nr:MULTISPECIES: helix-turn-helix transcriptional regulator [Furfurilactobacillus]KRL53299.1 transcription regulator [Furfurilactobacillus rossiae DSM 15814]MCF6161539.1 helix-turn-helix domain-containing protein [Furfurilactobacillus milii]MCF6163919.1 helix-turn-helix domain-containing protein [Furfurilactobacillus milii]MCF6164734.1 helix-turn-helix domain-containing protein [Furfurilactobacillus rossiae]MCF6419436.1 helix-turn-helix domain-containing protein [Furfurilactobacillus milii]